MTDKYKVVSLFSGCGGLDLGCVGGFKYRDKSFDENQYELVLSNDFDPVTQRVYDANERFFKHQMRMCDVKTISEDEIPDFDILLAGFPCQPFSTAGQRKGVDDYRGSLYKECERFLKVGNSRNHKPIAFVFENVKGILSSKVPNGLNVPEEIVRLSRKLGFNTTYQLLDASEYGVPSKRERVIIVGVRKDLPKFDFSILKQVRDLYLLPSADTNPFELSLGSALCDIPENAPQKNDFWEYSPGGQHMVEMIGPCYGSERVLDDFKKHHEEGISSFDGFPEDVKKGRSWKDIDPDNMPPRFRRIWDDPVKYHSPKFYRRFALAEINGTITASAQPENCGITHPFLNRRFTIREAARIQSFPDDFTFPYKSIQDAYKVIGNAVPPILGWVVMRSLYQHLVVSRAKITLNNMTEDQAYILGLFVGNGRITDKNHFMIELPVKKWGMGDTSNIISITNDIAVSVRDKFTKSYNIDIDFNYTATSWTIYQNDRGKTDLSLLENDLAVLGLPTRGFLLETASLFTARQTLSPALAESFISGICDTRGSVAKSHRRFTDSCPTISVEVPGSTRNYQFVTQFCSWLHDLDSYADQILYNNPCQHSASDPYYKGWAKGFKIRFLNKGFLSSKSFMLGAKESYAANLAKSQRTDDQPACENRTMAGRIKPICISRSIFSPHLPTQVRGKLFLHHLHICAVMHCPFAPSNDVKKHVREYRKYIAVTPLLSKGSLPEMVATYIDLQNKFFPGTILTDDIKSVKSLVESEMSTLYPELSNAVNFLVTSSLKGNRPIGNKDIVLKANENTNVKVRHSSINGAPILVISEINGRAAIVSSITSEYNQSLISKYITVSDLDICIDPSFPL